MWSIQSVSIGNKLSLSQISSIWMIERYFLSWWTVSWKDIHTRFQLTLNLVLLTCSLKNCNVNRTHRDNYNTILFKIFRQTSSNLDTLHQTDIWHLGSNEDPSTVRKNVSISDRRLAVNYMYLLRVRVPFNQSGLKNRFSFLNFIWCYFYLQDKVIKKWCFSNLFCRFCFIEKETFKHILHIQYIGTVCFVSQDTLC